MVKKEVALALKKLKEELAAEKDENGLSKYPGINAPIKEIDYVNLDQGCDSCQ